MHRRLLLVYAGQSNMMGAAVYPPQTIPHCDDSYEYLHKAVRMGAPHGDFIPAAFPSGEFCYADWKQAYAMGDPSPMNDYHIHTFFAPSMYTLKNDADKSVNDCKIFSEAHLHPGAALPPFVAEEWEKRGQSCAYAHIAKGSVSILYYFSDAMLASFNASAHTPAEITALGRGASAYFFQKSRDFFRDAVLHFPGENHDEKCLVWLQGESDCRFDAHDYALFISIFWIECKK